MTQALQLTPPGDFGVTVAPEAVIQRDKLIAEAQKVHSVGDDLDLEIAASAASALKALVKETERVRRLVKEPVTALGRQVDAAASYFIHPAQDEVGRIERLMTEYAAEQRRLAAEAEARRQAELARIEAERRAAEQAAARAEAARQAALEADRLAAERQMLGEKVKQSELRLIEQQQAQSAAQLEALRVQQAKLAQAQQAALTAPVLAPSRTEGMVTRTVWDFEVLDIWAVPRDFVRIEPNREAILAAARKGVISIPGLRLWSETKTGVR